MKGTFVTGPGRPASGDSASEKIYGKEPQSRETVDRRDPAQETADIVYREQERLWQSIDQALNRHSDNLLGFADEAKRIGRSVQRALAAAGIGPYDWGLADALVDGMVGNLVRAARGESVDEQRELTFNQDTRRELYATYTEPVATEHLSGVARKLKGTELGKLIAEANLTNHPIIARGLVEKYRADWLGR